MVGWCSLCGLTEGCNFMRKNWESGSWVTEQYDSHRHRITWKHPCSNAGAHCLRFDWDFEISRRTNFTNILLAMTQILPTGSARTDRVMQCTCLSVRSFGRILPHQRRTHLPTDLLQVQQQHKYTSYPLLPISIAYGQAQLPAQKYKWKASVLKDRGTHPSHSVISR